VLNFLNGTEFWPDKEKEDLYNIIKTIVAEEFNNPELLIIGNMDFGHTDPNLFYR